MPYSSKLYPCQWKLCIASQLTIIEKYSDSYLSEPELIRWEGWVVAIRGPDVDGLDSPKAIIRGSYMEIRAFEIAYHRIRGTAKSSSLMVDSRIAVEA